MAGPEDPSSSSADLAGRPGRLAGGPVGGPGRQQQLLGRLTLGRVVPGLEGSGLPSPPPTTLVYMVQITSAGL